MRRSTDESGFTLIEVAIASLISMMGLVFLASLFTLSISQNRMNKQFNVTTALAQEKLEEFNALDLNNAKLTVFGNLLTPTTLTVGGVDIPYFEDIYVIDPEGTVLVGADIPEGTEPNYRRFWMIEDDPVLANTRIISARVVALQAAYNDTNPDDAQTKHEQTTLATIRSF
jgi:type II secretory pathway pseudopilin PulG